MSDKQIIFEPIDDKYTYGKYNDLKIIIMNSNKYINANKLCKEYKKDFNNWKDNKSSIQLITEVDKYILSEEISINENKSLIEIKGEKNQVINGTYVHELLIHNIINWISAQCVIKVSKIINCYIKNEFNNEIKLKNIKITELKKKKSELFNQNNELNLKIYDMIINNKLLKKSNKKLEKNNNDITDNHEEINEKLYIVKKKLKYAYKMIDLCIENNLSKIENINVSIVILKCTKKNPVFQYIFIRESESDINKIIKNKVKDKYDEILRIDNVTNLVNFWNLLKSKLENKVEYCGYEINLIEINENEFLNIIQQVYEKIKNILNDEFNIDSDLNSE